MQTSVTAHLAELGRSHIFYRRVLTCLFLLASFPRVASIEPVVDSKVCSGEQFTATCQPHEVVITHSAQYGRMALTTCLSSVEFGFLGCANNVRPLVDSWCSGKRECQFFVPNHDLKTTNSECSKDLVAYLDLTYSCVPISHTGGYHCASGDTISLTEPEGYLSSHVTDATGCGSTTAPWRIEAKPGQTIEIEAIDFESEESATIATEASVRSSAFASHRNCPEIGGYIRDFERDLNKTVCRTRSQRNHVVYSSKGSSLEVALPTGSSRTNTDNTTHFLLHYKFIGCPDINPPAHAWYERDGNEAVIGCRYTEQRWPLICLDNSWEGEIGNCTLTTAYDSQGSSWQSNIKVAILSSIVGVTIVIVGVVITATLFYIRRRRRRRTRQLPHPCEGMGKCVSGYATNPYYQSVGVYGIIGQKTPPSIPTYAAVNKENKRSRHHSTTSHNSNPAASPILSPRDERNHVTHSNQSARSLGNGTTPMLPNQEHRNARSVEEHRDPTRSNSHVV